MEIMAGQGKTPDRVLNEFHRYKRAENSRRKGAFGLNFDTDEGRRFSEQIHILRGLKGQCHIKELALLTQEVHFPEELSDEQLLYYYSRRCFFARQEVREGEEFYARLYLLELANELHHSEAADALSAIFLLWDAMNQFATDPEYLLRLCISFLIVHPDMAEEIRKGLIERDLYWRYDLIGEIRLGRFQRAGLFVKRYSRLLKPEEISGDKPFIKATWLAMPEVFSCLDRSFGDKAEHLFRRFLTVGDETSTEVEILPVRRRALEQRRRILLSDTCYLDSRPAYGSAHKERWVKTEWILKEGARDLLYIIHLYAESFVREHYQAPRRKRTAARFLKKKYLRTGDDPSIIIAMKEVMRDSRFEQAVQEGVAMYMKSHPAPTKTGAVSRTGHAKLLYQMDHAKPDVAAAIDYDRFRQAKSDAESVLHMLHSEEINYNKTALEDELQMEKTAPDKLQVKKTTPDKLRTEVIRPGKELSSDNPISGDNAIRSQTETEGEKDALLENKEKSVLFSPEESRYLTLLLSAQREGAAEFLKRNGLSVNLVMKNINKKALELWEDILLVKKGTSVEVAEDYSEELRGIL